MLIKELISTKDEYANINISGIASDINEVRDGYAFVCIKGIHADGHDFAEKAYEKGACVIICEHKVSGCDNIAQIIVENSKKALATMWANYFYRPADFLVISAVTGTNGKTTVSTLLTEILKRHGCKCDLIGTVKNIVSGVELETKYTTPNPQILHSLFSQMVRNGDTHCVMEVSSHSLEQERVYGIKYRVCGFTNLTQDHLDYHSTMENYLNAKLKLFDNCDVGVINADSSYAKFFIDRCKSSVTYGIDNPADYFATNIKLNENGCQFLLLYREESVLVNINIAGKFSIYNALCAIAMADMLGVSPVSSADYLKNISGVEGRMQRLDINTDFCVIIDYAHTPDGLENVLTTLESIKKNRLICVFGCGGDRDRDKRHKMGIIAQEHSDFVVVTTDNPRTEDKMQIIEDIVSEMDKEIKNYVIIEDRKSAIEYAINIAQKDDIILIAGKGHENYQILKDRTVAFNEKDIVKDAIKIYKRGEADGNI